MSEMVRFPAFPLISSDPFVSVWSMSDRPNQSETRHWAGQRKRLDCVLAVDGESYSLVGRNGRPAAMVAKISVTPTATEYTYEVKGVRAVLSFRAPLILDDFDLLSMPVTMVDLVSESMDGAAHEAVFSVVWHDDICYDGEIAPPMSGDAFEDGGLKYAYMGKKRQDLLCNSGDHITIDWGYAYMASDGAVGLGREGGHYVLRAELGGAVGKAGRADRLLLGYDDVASINYFGYIARAWYRRNGATIVDALHTVWQDYDGICARLQKLDQELADKAEAVGGEAYRQLVCAAYRQSICAHKLIADEAGQPVFLSKENDSNGCMGTADVSYPSIPLYLLYAPELVRAMCRPVLKFANMPIWKADFAPHDVGRYPHATGQVYALNHSLLGAGLTDGPTNGEAHLPIYLYRGDRDVYDLRYQMPVEECGNMILMLAAAMRADGDGALAKAYLPTLETWVRYLIQYGADPGEQLCTDDFAGHLNHNVNLAFKAVCGVAAFGWMLEQFGQTERAAELKQQAAAMARQVYDGSNRGDHTALTLDGEGWSLKYNAIWDKIFGFGLLEPSFYDSELAYYLKMQNEYGVPLDSRADYTKSDWIAWVAAMSEQKEIVQALCRPMARYLAETPSRVPFSDWYDTKTGHYCHFMARSVQGGIFMPMLTAKWRG